MTDMNAEKAREIVDLPLSYIIEVGLSDTAYEAKGYLAALTGPEITSLCSELDALKAASAALVEALEHIEEYWNGGRNSAVDAIEEAKETASAALNAFRAATAGKGEK